MQKIHATLSALADLTSRTARALSARNKPLLLVAALMTASALLPMKTHVKAAKIPGYIKDKAIALIEGAVADAAGGHFTRNGKSVAKAGHVEMDFAQALFLFFYADINWGLAYTKQRNHLQGEEHIGSAGGYPLKDRRFAFHDYEIREADSTSRVYGHGISVPKNTEDIFIDGGTAYWDAKYVVHSTYRCDDERLRRPAGKFNVIIQYKLADLTYDGTKGGTVIQGSIDTNNIVKKERKAYKIHREKMSKVQQDKATNVDLLDDDTEIVEGPVAYGVCTRTWKLVWPKVSASDIPLGLLSYRKAQDLVDKLVNEHTWEIDESIDYGL
ncbi:MAG: hypothetical protein M2R46_05552 [Verrucomicrobia subdivision 3 bacterium]|nr:hypothetical protein [Limisphaerales bacterium]